MEIRDYLVLMNKCQLMEKYNKKLVIAKSTRGDFKKRLAPQGLKFKPTCQQKRKFQPSANKGKQPQKPFKRQKCPKCRKNHSDLTCLAGQNVCFGYGKLGHKLYECPTRNQ